MGISGLLENLKSIATKKNVSAFGGLKVAVDGHCWLHRGTYSCSKDITNGIATAKYISFFVGMIQLLRNGGITQILVVFDGLPLPNKVEVNQKRSATKRQNLELARAAENAGDPKLAMTYYQRSVSVTFEMVKNVMNALDELGIAYLVAPYESDAQLAFLSKRGIVDVVITEDSDAIAYGCPKVFLKMDRDGNGELLQCADLPLNQTLSFANWTNDQFLLFCCLAGCDYMPGLANFGVKSAYKVVAKHKTLSRVLDHLTLSGALNGYGGPFAVRLEQAILTFRHQTIYNPYTEATEPLTPLPEHAASISTSSAVSASSCGGAVAGTAHRKPNTDSNQVADIKLAFLGPQLDSATAKQLASGRLDPRSLQAPQTAQLPPQPLRDVPTSGSEGVNWEFTFPPAETETHHAGRASEHLSRSAESIIRWRSTEDHIDLLDLYPHRAAGAAAGATQAQGQSGAAGCSGRGRPKQPTAVKSVLPVSAAAASFASQQYRSALVSDNLQGMHRQARPRIVEPDYLRRHQPKRRRGEGGDDGFNGPRADLGVEMAARDDYSGEAETPVADDPRSNRADSAHRPVQPPTMTAPVLAPAQAPAPAVSKRQRFFDSPAAEEPSSPMEAIVDFETDPELSVALQHAVDDPFDPSDPLLDSEHSYLDNAPANDSNDPGEQNPTGAPPRGLPQFQDDVFNANVAQRLAPRLRDSCGTAHDARTSSLCTAPPLWKDCRGDSDRMLIRSADADLPLSGRFTPLSCVPPAAAMAVGKRGQLRIPTAQELNHVGIDATSSSRQQRSLWAPDEYTDMPNYSVGNSDHTWQTLNHRDGSAVAEVTRFLCDMDGYDARTWQQQRFPMLGGTAGCGLY